ncbi:unnamed protein product [Pleuronectes platessa]|uniref:Uncharacterized protein n=1 Tax=Pleuronectes platessa TaxID=8262 RepID=A0A9N7TTP9_PLEPL|nr:unnamed protein product [Pleuronectes platessa]
MPLGRKHTGKVNNCTSGSDGGLHICHCAADRRSESISDIDVFVKFANMPANDVSFVVAGVVHGGKKHNYYKITSGFLLLSLLPCDCGHPELLSWTQLGIPLLEACRTWALLM